MPPFQMFLTDRVDRVTRPFVNPVIDMSCQPNRFMCGSHGCSADSSVDSFTSTGSHTDEGPVENHSQLRAIQFGRVYFLKKKGLLEVMAMWF